MPATKGFILESCSCPSLTGMRSQSETARPCCTWRVVCYYTPRLCRHCRLGSTSMENTQDSIGGILIAAFCRCRDAIVSQPCASRGPSLAAACVYIQKYGFTCSQAILQWMALDAQLLLIWRLHMCCETTTAS